MYPREIERRNTWGELPDGGRRRELEARLAAWEQLPAAERGDPAKGEGRSASGRVGPRAWPGGLSGADVSYLAARAFAGGSADPDAVAAAAEQLRQRRFWDLSALHLQGAELGEARLDGAGLGGAHLDGADLAGAHLQGADLHTAHLAGADLHTAHLAGADLHTAHLAH